MKQTICTKLKLALTALIFLTSLGIYSAVSATSVDFTVTIPSTPVLQVTLSSSDVISSVSPSSINLNLTPNFLSAAFVSSDVNISVGTNNLTGYNLMMDLADTNLSSGSVDKIPSLGSGSYTCTVATAASCNFTANSWGYKIVQATTNQSATNYIAIPSSATLLNSKSGAIDNDTTYLNFGVRADSTQPAGSYTTTINFVATANPTIYYIQDMTNEYCSQFGGTYTVYDKRDGNEYAVRYINGNCWMTKDLGFSGTTLDSTTSNIAPQYTTSNPLTISFEDLTSGNSFTSPRLHIVSSPTRGFYNYCAATATTVCQNTSAQNARYDICPAGWALPTQSQFSTIISHINLFPFYKNAGLYSSGNLVDKNVSNYWSATSEDAGVRQYYLRHNSDNEQTIVSTPAARSFGFSIRCVAK